MTGQGYPTIFKLTHNGHKSLLHRFTGLYEGPDTLIRNSDGNFYGTAPEGGGSNNCFNDDRGCGTLFKLSASGKFTTLHTFQGGTDGGSPNGLMQDFKGNLYGNAEIENDSKCLLSTCVLLYEFSTTGKKTNRYTFGLNGEPVGSVLVLDPAGNFYGLGSTGNFTYGLIFELTLAPSTGGQQKK
jgi:uncharacterized repeat protein (TIGR03803 family)